ncbi:hypothetical protein FRC17_008123 [Serendipita sp. 399]|nr:hypothetical protein FRC17_008123 [Serendipita sp. 399]
MNTQIEMPSNFSLLKLYKLMEISRAKKCAYAWADTVCINKESSAELDESIRSMFAWYRDSRICIVHLGATAHYVDMQYDPWFTRGWTLQELLAPRRLVFYSQLWNQITTRDSEKYPAERVAKLGKSKGGEEEDSLWSLIAKITGIDVKDLHNFTPGLQDIGKRLSWASRRTTTRIEDMAYCLIGIFDINLSIAYGEKERAFYRLQVEILQNKNDMSLFDWRGEASTYNSMLAASPECFSKRFGLRRYKSLLFGGDPTFTLTNVGVRMSQVVHQLGENSAPPSWKTPGATAFSILGATSTPGYYIIMILRRIVEEEEEEGEGDHRQYERLKLVEDSLDLDSYEKESEVIFIR